MSNFGGNARFEEPQRAPEDEGFAYVGWAACGCPRAVIVDELEHRREVATEIARWVRRGLTLTRAPIVEVRRLSLRCPHGRKA